MQACEIVVQKAEDDLMPLVELLTQRLTHVFNQIPTVIEDILSQSLSVSFP